MEDFQAVVEKCKKCGQEYLVACQSPTCPHSSLIPTPNELDQAIAIAWAELSRATILAIQEMTFGRKKLIERRRSP